MGIIEKRIVEGFICADCGVSLMLPKPEPFKDALETLNEYGWSMVRIWKGRNLSDYFCIKCKGSALERFHAAQKKAAKDYENRDFC